MTEDFEMTGMHEKYPEYNNIGDDELIKEYDRLNVEDYDSLSDESKERLEYVKRLTEDIDGAGSDDSWSKEWEEDQAKVWTVGDDNDTDLTTQGQTPRLDELFGKRYFEYKVTTKLFDILGLEDECKERGFVKWLMDKKAFSVERVMSESRILTDYKFEYYGYDENRAKPFRRFETIGEAISGEDHITAITEIREYYDQYRREKLNKILKKVGIVTAVGVSLISVITGLSLGLKRKGHDLVRDSENTPWKKLNHSKTPWKNLKSITPWKKITGEGLIIIGDNIYLVIGGVCVGSIFTEKINKRIFYDYWKKK